MGKGSRSDIQVTITIEQVPTAKDKRAEKFEGGDYRVQSLIRSIDRINEASERLSQQNGAYEKELARQAHLIAGQAEKILRENLWKNDGQPKFILSSTVKDDTLAALSSAADYLEDIYNANKQSNMSLAVKRVLDNESQDQGKIVPSILLAGLCLIGSILILLSNPISAGATLLAVGAFIVLGAGLVGLSALAGIKIASCYVNSNLLEKLNLFSTTTQGQRKPEAVAQPTKSEQAKAPVVADKKKETSTPSTTKAPTLFAVKADDKAKTDELRSVEYKKTIRKLD